MSDLHPDLREAQQRLAAAAHLSQLPMSEDVAEMFRCALRCQELEGVFWERRYRGDDLM